MRVLIPVVVVTLLAPEDSSGPGWSGSGARLEQAMDTVVTIPIARFEGLPESVIEALEAVDCQVPQAYAPEEPHNVTRGRFAAPDQEDWAALCKMGDWSGIVVVWGGAVRCPGPISVAFDGDAFQSIGDGRVGYSRGVTTADMRYILEHAEAYGGPQPPSRDHDGINDAFIGKASVVHYCHHGRWYLLQGAD